MKQRSLGRRLNILLLVAAAIAGAPQLRSGDDRQRKVPSQQADGSYLLPNGWTLAPAGTQVPLDDFPLALAVHPDGRRVFVSCSGFGEQSVVAIDVAARTVSSRSIVASTWLGLTLDSTGSRLFAGGGAANAVLAFDPSGNDLAPLPEFRIAPPGTRMFPGGLCTNGNRLYVANNLGNSVSSVDLADGSVRGTAQAGDHPYTCVSDPGGQRLFVSLWGAARVAVVDAASLAILATIPTEDHPNAMALTNDGRRLFVATANSNNVAVIDTERRRVIERVSVALYPDSPAGSTPNAVALSPDNRRLFVANADNNCVAVVDISNPESSRTVGFIPAGWYPTAVGVSPDGRTLYVANGKGERSGANPDGPVPGAQRQVAARTTFTMLRGSLSVVPVPDNQALARYTSTVYRNVPYSPRRSKTVAFDGRSAIPNRVGRKSPIRYVIYVVKENRTYDQVLGDMPEGNGDPALTLFGEDVTPNHHALAREFVLFDNFYADAEISPDGHNWSMGAYATDYVEKLWPSHASGRRGLYDFESAPIAAPTAGYIWDACRRAGVTYRSYGEWIRNGATPNDPAVAESPALEGHIDPYYRGYDLAYSDLDRAARFLSELSRFEREGEMPRLQIVRLGNDHTAGTRPGAPTPTAYVAQNDLALGRIVEGVSRSRFWPRTAVFVVEDDAQNGPDHVDAHRTVALVASPYARRGAVDSTMYSTSSLLRTMELILGLQPMSQYDAAAMPMMASFVQKPGLKPYAARPARVSLTEVNRKDAVDADRSLEMDLDEADAAPDLEFNEIIWRAVRGAGSTMPAPVRAAFVRPR